MKTTAQESLDEVCLSGSLFTLINDRSCNTPPKTDRSIRLFGQPNKPPLATITGMKNLLTLVFTWMLLLPAVAELNTGAKLEELTTKAGKRYESVTIKAINPEGIRVMYSDGFADIPKADIPDNVASQLKFPEPVNPQPRQTPSVAAWRKDFGVFVQTVADLAPKAQADRALKRSAEGYFNKVEVLWDLTFKDVAKDENGNDVLNFDLVPFIKGNFLNGTGTPVVVGGFAPAKGTTQAWRKIKPGSHVKVRAVVDVAFATVNEAVRGGGQPVIDHHLAVVSIKQAALAE